MSTTYTATPDAMAQCLALLQRHHARQGLRARQLSPGYTLTPDLASIPARLAAIREEASGGNREASDWLASANALIRAHEAHTRAAREEAQSAYRFRRA